MPQFWLSRHAKNRMRRESLSPDDVASIVTRPERTTRDALGHTIAWRQMERFWLGVVYALEGDVVAVITVLPSKQPKGQ